MDVRGEASGKRSKGGCPGPRRKPRPGEEKTIWVEGLGNSQTLGAPRESSGVEPHSLPRVPRTMTRSSRHTFPASSSLNALEPARPSHPCPGATDNWLNNALWLYIHEPWGFVPLIKTLRNRSGGLVSTEASLPPSEPRRPYAPARGPAICSPGSSQLVIAGHWPAGAGHAALPQEPARLSAQGGWRLGVIECDTPCIHSGTDGQWRLDGLPVICQGYKFKRTIITA